MTRPDKSLLVHLLCCTVLLGASGFALSTAMTRAAVADAAYEAARSEGDRVNAALGQLRMEAPRIQQAAARLREAFLRAPAGDEDVWAQTIASHATRHRAQDFELAFLPARAEASAGKAFLERLVSLQARFPHEGHFVEMLQELAQSPGRLAVARHCALDRDAASGLQVRCELDWLTRDTSTWSARP